MTRRNERNVRGAKERESVFSCAHCGRMSTSAPPGTRHRNHCPHCLCSLHVDIRPGDRRSGCRGRMVPIAVWVKPDGEWALVHRCERCGKVTTNRIAGDDDALALEAIATRPLQAGRP